MNNSKNLTDGNQFNWTTSNTFLGTTALAVFGYPLMGRIDLPEPARMYILLGFFHENLDINYLMHEMEETGEPASEERLKYMVCTMTRGIEYAFETNDLLLKDRLIHDIQLLADNTIPDDEL